ncbi:MAG: FixH family protein [Verrucomicrobiota bacterium]|jgi:nitrogen fixation protein FixH
MKTKFNPWPYGIIAFFILLFCGIATVVVIAATHRETMVSENYYEQELKFQDQIDSAARAQKCGAHLGLDARGGKLTMAVPAQQLTQQFSGAIEFYRPSSPDLDCQFPLAPGTDGAQAVDVSKLRAGLWQVRVKWVAGGQSYFLEQKVVL